MLCLPQRQAFGIRLIPFPSPHCRSRPPISTFLSPQNSSSNLNGSHENPRSYLLRAYRWDDEADEAIWSGSGSGSESNNLARGLEEAVKLFNKREYYECHDVLESLWYESLDPLRTLLHALLQCAVAFHHLSNQNHKGAMMELGEGLCKLRKMNFQEGPFYQFEQEISAVLEFIYQTQLELAACNEDFCLAMDQTERSYQLLEGFGAGQRLYSLEASQDGNKEITYIVFDPKTSYGATGVPSTRVKLPTLQATRNHLIACQNY